MWKKNFKKTNESDSNFKVSRSKDCFSFAPQYKNDEALGLNQQDNKTIYLHIPGYLKDEVQEQSFTPAQVTVKYEKTENMDDKKLILQELYSTQNNNQGIRKQHSKKNSTQSIKKNQENKENHIKEKTKTKPKSKPRSIQVTYPKESEKTQKKFIKKYQLPGNFFEAAREANEVLEKQMKSKCL